jgi:hypothetical protein
MGTSRNEEIGLIEAEARRILPDGFQVECRQIGLTEEFIVWLTKGGRSQRLSFGITGYEERDWRAYILAEAREMEESAAEPTGEHLS